MLSASASRLQGDEHGLELVMPIHRAESFDHPL
jgi:hypothetical protein